MIEIRKILLVTLCVVFLASCNGGSSSSTTTSNNSTMYVIGGGLTFLTNNSSTNNLFKKTFSSGTTNLLRNINYINGNYVVVGQQGTILTSGDGIIWAKAETNTELDFNSVAGDPIHGGLIAVGEEGQISQSLFGDFWDTRASDPAVSLNSIIYAESEYIVVGFDHYSQHSIILKSSDMGFTWSKTDTNLNSGGAVGLTSINYNNGLYVAVGESGTIVTSNNAESWTIQTSETNERLNFIGNFNNTYIAVGTNGTILTSSNGMSWTAKNSGKQNTLSSASFINNTYVVSGSNGAILTSSDTNTWALETVNTNRHIYSLINGNNQIVAVGHSGLVLNSVNASNWDFGLSGMELLAGAANRNEVLFTGHDLLSGKYGVFIHLNTLTKAFSINTDDNANGITSIIYTDQYVGVKRDGVILTSNDGNTWESHITGANGLSSISYGMGKYVAVGLKGQIYTSTDTITWAQTTSNTINSLLKVIYANGEFTAVGQNGTILTSTNGITWNPQVSETEDSINVSSIR